MSDLALRESDRLCKSFWMPPSLAQLESAIRGSWCLWTADPVDQAGWSSSNPASGQCASTALLVYEAFGGEVLIADVQHRDGTCQGFHYSNRLPDGTSLDLTGEQFVEGEIIGPTRLAQRPPDLTLGRLAGQYRLLRTGVERRLRAPLGPADASRPLSVKGVCFDGVGRALLCRNWRGEWELPGGRPEVGERFDDCVVREFREETGIVVEARNVVDAYAFEVTTGAWVDVLVLGCVAASSSAPIVSTEHQTVQWLDPTEIEDAELPAGYRQAVSVWSARAVEHGLLDGGGFV